MNEFVRIYLYFKRLWNATPNPLLLNKIPNASLSNKNILIQENNIILL